MKTSDLYGAIFKIWRPKRLAQYRKILSPKASDRVLDVGGYPFNWVESPQDVELIECLNLNVYPWKEEKDFPEHRIKVLEGNGCDLPYADASYPIVFSNSVIEHRFQRAVRRWIGT